MKKYTHETHTAFCIREKSSKHSGILIMKKTGNKQKARDRWHPYNWRFLVTTGKPRWHWFIRLPFFLFYRDNCGFELGTQNLYLWVIS